MLEELARGRKRETEIFVEYEADMVRGRHDGREYAAMER